MSRQIAEMCARFGYMKLCVETDLNVGEVWLQLPVCRQRSEQWVTVDYMKLCVDRDLNSG